MAQAIAQNVAQKLQFVLRAPILEPFPEGLLQDVMPGENALELHEHGTYSYALKTHGRASASDTSLTYLYPSDSPFSQLVFALHRGTDPVTGCQALPSDYKERWVLQRLRPDTKTPLDEIVMEGAMIYRATLPQFSRREPGLLESTLSVSVDYYTGGNLQ